jgi:hypothetical protein
VPGIVLLAALTTFPLAPAADTSSAADVQDGLQIPVDQRRRIARGEIVAYPLSENSEREIAAGLVMVVAAPAGQIAQYLASGQLLANDATIGEFGQVPSEVASRMVGPGFASSERDEAQSLLDASPGTKFNLSGAEITTLHAAKSSAGNVVEIASGSYGRLLSERVQSYRQRGLEGIAPYARSGGANTDPTVELRLAIADIERIGRAGAELHEALRHYPADQPSQLASQVYWVKRRVQRRPHLSLLHRIVTTSGGPVIHLERYFYSPHSFNSMVILTGSLAYEEGTMVFVATRVSTDEVLGVGSQLKRTVARGQVRDEMRARFEKLRSLVSRPAGAESP